MIFSEWELFNHPFNNCYKNSNIMSYSYLLLSSFFVLSFGLTGEEVSQQCHCDVTSSFCDFNCCCDTDCSNVQPSWRRASKLAAGTLEAHNSVLKLTSTTKLLITWLIQSQQAAITTMKPKQSKKKSAYLTARSTIISAKPPKPLHYLYCLSLWVELHLNYVSRVSSQCCHFHRRHHLLPIYE